MQRRTTDRVPRRSNVIKPVSEDEHLRFFEGLINASIGSVAAWTLIYLIYKAVT